MARPQLSAPNVVSGSLVGESRKARPFARAQSVTDAPRKRLKYVHDPKIQRNAAIGGGGAALLGAGYYAGNQAQALGQRQGSVRKSEKKPSAKDFYLLGAGGGLYGAAGATALGRGSKVVSSDAGLLGAKANGSAQDAMTKLRQSRRLRVTQPAFADAAERAAFRYAEGAKTYASLSNNMARSARRMKHGAVASGVLGAASVGTGIHSGRKFNQGMRSAENSNIPSAARRGRRVAE